MSALVLISQFKLKDVMTTVPSLATSIVKDSKTVTGDRFWLAKHISRTFLASYAVHTCLGSVPRDVCNDYGVHLAKHWEVCFHAVQLCCI